MNSPMVSLQCLLFVFLIFLTSVSATLVNIPRLSPIGGTFLRDSEKVSASISEDFQTFYYDQTLDHFNYRPESYTTFKQRYVINFKYWGGATSHAPIFVYFGAEAPLDGDLSNIGFLPDNALQFKALIVYIEHRYYGQSVPFGSREEALGNSSTLGYFNSAQAIADYAEIILHVKKKLRAKHSPVIVIGGSYGGMLASWFRLKYPHVALGALASSAPILYFDDITPQNGYFSIVTKDFRSPKHIFGAQGLLGYYVYIPVQPNIMILQIIRLTIVCGGIDGAPSNTSILGKIFAGVVAYRGIRSCYVNPPRNISETSVGWRWQTCSEMVIPIGRNNDTMFPPDPFILSSYIEYCTSMYGVPPRPHWVTSYYGGHDLIAWIYSLQMQSDPEWLVRQRKVEVNIIKGWITKYYADLLTYKK
uniref:Lysosomal Pro-X carboxypeptidase n=1 Tax=Fagus sylvatica TaxID=28930 RepID=A0A2N9GMD1_FAGSY